MTEQIMQLDVRMLRWSDSSTAGRTATFELDPMDGIEHPLRHFASGAKNGQRFRVLIAPIDDDESSALPDVQAEVVAPAAKPKDPGKSERAKESYRSLDAMGQAVVRCARLCNDAAFQTWIADGDAFSQQDPAGSAAVKVRYLLSIKSRKEIGTNEAAYERFKDLEYQFQHRDDPAPR